MRINMSHILNTPRTYQLNRIHPSLEIQIETNRSVVDTDSTHAFGDRGIIYAEVMAHWADFVVTARVLAVRGDWARVALDRVDEACQDHEQLEGTLASAQPLASAGFFGSDALLKLLDLIWNRVSVWVLAGSSSTCRHHKCPMSG